MSSAGQGNRTLAPTLPAERLPGAPCPRQSAITRSAAASRRGIAVSRRDPRGPRPKSLPALLVDALNEKVVATIDGELRDHQGRRGTKMLSVHRGGRGGDGDLHHKAPAILSTPRGADDTAARLPKRGSAPYIEHQCEYINLILIFQ